MENDDPSARFVGDIQGKNFVEHSLELEDRYLDSLDYSPFKNRLEYDKWLERSNADDWTPFKSFEEWSEFQTKLDRNTELPRIDDLDYSPFKTREQYKAWVVEQIEAAKILNLERELAECKKKFRKSSLSARVYLFCNLIQRTFSKK